MSTLDDLGSDVAEALGVGPDVERALAQRQRVIEELVPSRELRRWRIPLVVGGSLALTAALSLVWIYVPSATTGSREGSVASDGTGLHAGMYLQAPENRAMRVELGDGGHFLLAPGARARVIEASEAGVHVALEDGGIEANLTADAGLPYLIEAGPLRIASLTARFDLRWNATLRAVEIDVVAGDVEVTGGSFGESGLRVASGTHVMVGADGALVLGDKRGAGARDGATAEMNETTPEAATAAADDSAETRLHSGKKRARTNAGQAQDPRSNWRKLAENGEYTAALRAAEEAGFSELVDRLGAADLRRLADAARVARDGDRAREALLALRERFPASRDGKLATFLLGRVATELDRNHKKAAHWFETYSRENPTGSLRQIADGRIIDELHKAGEPAAAKAAARRYLERYESGPYHDLARSLAE